MKAYLLLFHNESGKDNYITTPEDMVRDMPLWQQWIGMIAMEGKLISSQPIEYNGAVVRTSGSSEGPLKTPDNLLLTGYLLCNADSMEEVEAWGKSCPILQYPRGVVEIRPVIPFPNN